MIDNINHNNIQKLWLDPSAQPTKAQKTVSEENIDTQMQTDYTSLVDKALKASTTDSDAVEQAKELLASGELDTAENIRSAAENILKFGI